MVDEFFSGGSDWFDSVRVSELLQRLSSDYQNHLTQAHTDTQGFLKRSDFERDKGQFFHHLDELLLHLRPPKSKNRDELVRHHRPPRSKNRLCKTLEGLISNPGRLKAHQLQEDDIQTIWGWVGDKNAFFQAAVESTNPPEDPGQSLPRLNSICCLLGQMRTQERIDKVRGRLLQYFLARFVERHISNARDVKQVTRQVLDRGLIAPEVMPNLVNNLQTWVAGGRCYMQLARVLGGAGVLIYLPLIGSSSWETHCRPSGMYGDQNYKLVRRIRVPQAANEERWASNVGKYLDAHQLVESLVDDFLEECASSLVNDAPDSTQTGGLRFRRGRLAVSTDSASPSDVSQHTFSIGVPSLSGGTPLFSAYSPLGDDDQPTELSDSL